MRVIAGSAKRMNLYAPDTKVRPTTDRTKESLFNMIAPNLYSAQVLDLFAGSGALGIEALSRGSKKCWFFDNNKESIECIKKNLEHTKLIEKAKILQYDYVKALGVLKNEGVTFDIVFLDPPYNQGFDQHALEILHENHLLNSDGIIIIESDIKTEINVERLLGLRIYKEKKYKTNKFTFIVKEVD